jgi:hypothetical protein
VTTYKSTELSQIWQHIASGHALVFDAVAPLDETDENAEYRYSKEGLDLGSETGLILQGWTKLDEYTPTSFSPQCSVVDLINELRQAVRQAVAL